MTNEIPPLPPRDEMPPIHTQADLDRHWRALMGPLGFSKLSLWLMFVGPEGQCVGQLTQIDEIPARPDQQLLEDLLAICAEIIERDLPLGTRVAFLRSRPGAGVVDADDMAWAGGLVRAARGARVPCEPVHLATDERVTVVAFDDLTSRAG